MADDDDLEYSETNIGSAQSQEVRKNISIKLKGRGRGEKGRKGASSKKTMTGSVDEEEVTKVPNESIPEEASSIKQVSEPSLDEVILKLETPSFSPMDRTLPEPLHQNKKLRWNHKVNLIGEKIIDPMIHCCEKCLLPILNYGRLIPCKHVFCYDCAKKSLKVCPKCKDDVQKVEQANVGTVFMCTFGDQRHGPVHCGRTYLSQRDLQAHINHRHVKPAAASRSKVVVTPTDTVMPAVSQDVAHPIRDPRDPRAHLQDGGHVGQTVLMTHSSHPTSEHRDQEHGRNSAPLPQGGSGQTRQYSHSSPAYPSVVPVSSARPNLITVPIQDDSSSAAIPAQHSQSHQPQYTPPGSTPTHTIPPLQHPQNSYQPPHGYQHPLPSPAYSPSAPITTPSFPPQHPPPSVHHAPPPMHPPNRPMYPQPPVSHPPVHHPPPLNFSGPQGAPPTHNLTPRFQSPANYEDPTYISAWPSGVPPPPGNHNMGHMPPRGPSDPNYRPPYYQ